MRLTVIVSLSYHLASSVAAGQPADDRPECRRDQDCAVLPRRCPWCGPSQRSLRDVGTREEARRIADYMARAKCVPVPCPPGSSKANWVDTEARCAQGRCVGIQKVAAELHGDTRTRLIHTSICPKYRCKSCTAKLTSEAAGVKAGYCPHLACRPSRLGVHPDLACRRDADCMFAYTGFCGRCPAPQDCLSAWLPVTNRAAFDRARGGPKAPPPQPTACGPCPSCPPGARWLGTKAVCIYGQCEVR